MGYTNCEQVADLRKIPGTANILETKLATLLGTVAVLEAGSNFRSAYPQRGEQVVRRISPLTTEFCTIENKFDLP